MSLPEMRVTVHSKLRDTVEIREFILLKIGQWHRTGTMNMPRAFWERWRKPMMVRGAFASGVVLTIDETRAKQPGTGRP